MLIKQKLEELFSKLKNQIKYSEDLQCSICLKNLDNSNQLELECSHFFHISCISDWKKRNNTCPICRKMIAVKKNPIKMKLNNIIQNDKIILDVLIRIIIIISTIILILSLIPWSRTSFGLKTISKKIYNLGAKITTNILKIVKLILEIIFMFLKGIFYAIMKICINFVYILYLILKIIYYIFSLVLTIILGVLMIIFDIIIDCLNFIIFTMESTFKFI
jgi:hypothetical protein